MSAIRLASVLTLVLMVSSLLTLVGSVAATGVLEQQPAMGFFEPGVVIRITDSTSATSTTFTQGEVLTVAIETEVVDLSAGERRNQLRILDRTGNELDIQGFSQTTTNLPYTYSGTIAAPNQPGHYLLEVRIEQDNPARDTVRFFDMISVRAGPNPPSGAGSIATFADGWTTGTSEFGPTQRIFIAADTGGEVVDPANSRISFRDYRGERDRRDLIDLDDPRSEMVGSEFHMVYDLAVDLDPGQLAEGALVASGAWYDLVLDLQDAQGNAILTDWGVQVEVVAPTMTMVSGDLSATPVSIDRDTNEKTNLTAHFTIPSAPAVSTLAVDLLVRDPTGQELILIDDGHDGMPGVFGDLLSVVSPTSGEYTASITWDPTGTAEVGNYDLGFAVSQGGTEVLRDPFAVNQAGLEVTSSATPPVLNVGAVQVVPATLDLGGTNSTQISVQFTDDPTAAAGDFAITFTIRAQDGTQTILVDDLTDGQAGLFGLPLSVSESAPGVFLAAYRFDPGTPLTAGAYDLSASVRNAFNLTATDGFGANRDELILLASGVAPQIRAGDTRAVPSVVDRMAGIPVVISTQFTDDDAAAATTFQVGFKLLDGGVETVLVAEAKAGDVGAFGGTTSVLSSAPGVYVASYSFTPVASFPIGTYDLQFTVTDGTGNSATDPFNQNRNELEVLSSSVPPVFVPGATQAVPTIIATDGTTPVTISLEFTDADGGPASGYSVSFQLSSSNGTLDLITAGGTGDTGLDGGTLSVVSPSTGTYLATYTWIPAADTAPGEYSLRAIITDGDGNQVEDPATSNPGGLTIEAASGSTAGGSDTPWVWVALAGLCGLLLLILVILAIVIILILRKRSDKGAPSSGAPATTDGDRPTEAGSDIEAEDEGVNEDMEAGSPPATGPPNPPPPPSV